MKLPDIISVLVGVDYCLICYRSRFSFLYFEVRVLCRHKKSSRSLSYLLIRREATGCLGG